METPMGVPRSGRDKSTKPGKEHRNGNRAVNLAAAKCQMPSIRRKNTEKFKFALAPMNSECIH